jgi:hypothetical protein
LGKKEHWTGGELPAILGPVYRQGEDGRVVPNRVMWPSFWGVVSEGRVTPLSPEKVYDITRRSLRVRKDFVDELLKPKMRSSELKELVGEERYRLEDEWTDEEREKVDARQAELGREEFNEKVYKALEAIEEEEDAEQAVFVSSGVVYARDAENETLQPIELESADATQMVHWPMAHNVRPSGWSLGVKGCTECHSDQGKIFVSTVAATGPGPDDGEATTMAALQGVPEDQRLAWNELFKGRKNFKLLVGGSIAVLLMTLMIGVGAFASRVGNRKQLASTEG